jgi:kynurenine formamidase
LRDLCEALIAGFSVLIRTRAKKKSFAGRLLGEICSELFEVVGFLLRDSLTTAKDDYSLETYILSTNYYQIELLTNLDQVPESGGLVVVSFPKARGGSGFPARVFAILP